MIAIFPEIVQTAKAGNTERLSVLTRQYFTGQKKYSPVLDLNFTIKQLGISLGSLSLDCHGTLVAKDRNGKFEIAMVVNRGLDPFQEKFLKAHLLGHFFLHVQPKIVEGEWDVDGFKEQSCPLERFIYGKDDQTYSKEELKQQEEADKFAAAIILPQGMLRRAMEKLQDVDKVARFFAVPATLVEARFNRLQPVMRDASQPANFFEAEKQIQDTDAAPSVEQSEIDKLRRARQLLEGKEEFSLERKKIQGATLQAPQNTQQQDDDSVIKKDRSKPRLTAEQLGSAKGMDRIRAIAKLLDKTKLPKFLNF